MFPFVAELSSGGFAVELPVDLGVGLIGAAIPGSSLLTQSLQVGNSSGTEALPREHADFDFGLIEPASVSRRVVNRESVPDFAAYLLAEQVRQ